MPIFMCVDLVLPNPLNIQGPCGCLSSSGVQGRFFSGPPQPMQCDSRGPSSWRSWLACTRGSAWELISGKLGVECLWPQVPISQQPRYKYGSIN